MRRQGVRAVSVWRRGARRAAGAAVVLGTLSLGAGGDAQPKAVEIGVISFEFQPKTVTVKAGTPVVWTQKGGGRHSVIAADGSFTSPFPMGEGNPFTFTPTKAGKLVYYCKFHGDPAGADMAGVLDVRN